MSTMYRGPVARGHSAGGHAMGIAWTALERRSCHLASSLSVGREVASFGLVKKAAASERSAASSAGAVLGLVYGHNLGDDD